MTKFDRVGFSGSVKQNGLVVLSCQSCLRGARISWISFPHAGDRASTTKVPWSQLVWLGEGWQETATLSKTQLAKEGQLIETDAGFTFFWSGCPVDENYRYQETEHLRKDLSIMDVIFGLVYLYTAEMKMI